MSPCGDPTGNVSVTTPRYVHVALPLPLAASYRYRVPIGMDDRVRPGARVVAPVRRREMVGIVVAPAEPPDDPAADAACRDLLAAPDAEPALPPDLLDTARWIARYYGAPLGLTLRAMLPKALWGASRYLLVLEGAAHRVGGGTAGDLVAWLAARGGEAPIDQAARALRRPLWDVADRLARVGVLSLRCVPAVAEPARAVERLVVAVQHPTLLERETLFRRAPRQRELLDAIESHGGSVPLSQLLAQTGAGPGVLRALVARGVVEVRNVPVHRDPFKDEAGSPPPDTLTAAQKDALRLLQERPPGGASLLFGVTGSGKTLVYLEQARAVLDAGRGVVLLVPEISLTPQTVRRVRGVFGDQVAVLHSGLSDGERLDAWQALRDGKRMVAVGPRSAVFAPVRNLGLIVVDEEHEGSYKNGETPRYHARDVAMVRARLTGARVVLGSATPSLDTWTAAEQVPHVVLPERIGSRPLPPVELVDVRAAPLLAEAAPVPWSEALHAAVLEALARKEQVLLLLNRRGFAARLQCRACAAVVECPHCSISLTVHRAPDRLRCHYCDYQSPLSLRCTACGGAAEVLRGIGTQQLERVVGELIPKARIARMDLDTTGTRWSHHRIFEAVDRGETDILLGTQMIAKGIDFPNVTVVGVVDADTGLHLPDFRAGERTFQLLAQVAGRAGRGPRGGRVLIQTRQPEHPAIQCAARHDSAAFLEQERVSRVEPPYPPWTSLVNLVVSGTDPEMVDRAADEAAAWVGALLSRHRLPVTLLGPAPCPIARISDRWRAHLLLKGARQDLGRLVRYLASRLVRLTGGPGRRRAALRVSLDRDPVSLL